MRLFISLLFSYLFLASCSPKQEIDTIYWGATFYTVDSAFSTAEAVAVHQGKIVAVGDYNQLKNQFAAKQSIDWTGKYVYPGFIDAHCHFLGYGLNLQRANLIGTKSFEEVVQRLQKHHKATQTRWVLGRGWDQNDWPNKQFPTKDLLDKAFPETPVYIRRVDGHAAIVNSVVLKMAKITPTTTIEGGEVIVADGKATGVLIDNAMELVQKLVPSASEAEKTQALMAAQEKCFEVGLSSVHDAGLDKDNVLLMDKLHKSNDLKMRVYAMLSPSNDNLEHFMKKGIYKTDFLNVRSVKMYADGALGSRGAKLIDPYHDAEHTNGLLVTTPEELKKWFANCKKYGYQANTHAIGDSANRLVLNFYAQMHDSTWNHRWRIEHAQVINQADFMLFGSHGIVPSVQPTHATSDMPWAADRLGDVRVKGAYAYKQLLDENGWLPLGTDFPIENINPLYTFFAVVARQDLQNQPAGGWQKENALTRQQALRGITVWAAKAAFEENEKGSIEVGKFADFVVMNQDLMTVKESEIPKLKIAATCVDGEIRFQQK